MLAEKRIDGIIRWLERLKKSYKSGAMESALMDAECARADLEVLRQEVWSKAVPSAVPHNGIRASAVFRAAVLAAAIVMSYVAPLAKDVPSVVIEHNPETLTLAEPIVIVREDTPSYEAPAPVQRTPVQKKTAKRTPSPARKRVQAQPDVKPAPVRTVPYDKVFSLVQTGQRALKNTSTVIKID